MILRERGAAAGQIAAQVIHTEPAADPEAVALLRDAARDALALGDAAGAGRSALPCLDEPRPRDERAAVLLEFGRQEAAIAAAAIELGGVLFYAGRASERAASAAVRSGAALGRAGGTRAARG
jgi:hypothetical protein